MVELIFWLSALGIVYTYFAYPVLVGLLARLHRRAPAYPPSTPFVTLLIAAHNEQDAIAAKIENSLALDYPADRLQIVVATDGSTDATVEIVQAFSERGVVLSHSAERGGKAAAINRAIELARGDIVIFSDANNFYDEQTLRAVVAPFADAGVGAVCGNKHIIRGDGAVGDSEGAYWKYEGWIKRQETRLGSTVAVLGELLAVRRELFEPLPDNIINDDFYLAMRILKRGLRVLYVPEAISRERVSPTAGDEVARRTRMVAGVYQALARPREVFPWKRPVVCWELVSHKFMRPLVPLWMIACYVTNLILVVEGHSSIGSGRLSLSWLAVLGVQIAFYFVAVLGMTHTTHGRLSKVLYLPTYLLNSNVAALQGLCRYSMGQQSVLWTRSRRRA